VIMEALRIHLREEGIRSAAHPRSLQILNRGSVELMLVARDRGAMVTLFPATGSKVHISPGDLGTFDLAAPGSVEALVKKIKELLWT
jgi:hypothetical protein